jgi:hypothetical protein
MVARNPLRPTRLVSLFTELQREYPVLLCQNRRACSQRTAISAQHSQPSTDVRCGCCARRRLVNRGPPCSFPVSVTRPLRSGSQMPQPSAGPSSARYRAIRPWICLPSSPGQEHSAPTLAGFSAGQVVASVAQFFPSPCGDRFGGPPNGLSVDLGLAASMTRGFSCAVAVAFHHVTAVGRSNTAKIFRCHVIA